MNGYFTTLSAIALAATISINAALAANPAATKTAPSPTAAKGAASQATKTTRPSPADCLEKVREISPVIKESVAKSRKTVLGVIPDPAAFEKNLPPLSKVVESKDKIHFNSWASLAEAYLAEGKNKARADEIYKQVVAAAPTVLGPDDLQASLFAGDLALFYFDEKNYAKAEAMCNDALPQMEKHKKPELYDSMIAIYYCMAMCKDADKNTAEAQKWAVKVVDLIIDQAQQKAK